MLCSVALDVSCTTISLERRRRRSLSLRELKASDDFKKTLAISQYFIVITAIYFKT